MSDAGMHVGGEPDRRTRTDPPSWAPVPDPTVLTTEQLLREINNLRSFFDAIVSTHTEIDRVKFEAVHSRIVSEIANTKALTDLQFQLIERQRVESKNDTEKALAAALAAQKEAAGVLATFTADQLKALGTNFATATDQIRKDIGELKEGSRAAAGQKQGGTEARTATFAVAAFVAVLLSIGSVVFGVSRSATPAPAAPVVVTVPVPATTPAK